MNTRGAGTISHRRGHHFQDGPPLAGKRRQTSREYHLQHNFARKMGSTGAAGAAAPPPWLGAALWPPVRLFPWRLSMDSAGKAVAQLGGKVGSSWVLERQEFVFGGNKVWGREESSGASAVPLLPQRPPLTSAVCQRGP